MIFFSPSLTAVSSFLTLQCFSIDFQRSYPDRWREAVDAELNGQVVITTYRNTTYTISSVVWDKTVDSTYKEDSPETFREYFQRVSNLLLITPVVECFVRIINQNVTFIFIALPK